MADPLNIAGGIDLTYTSSDFKTKFGSKASALPAAVADRLRAGGANVQLIAPQPGATLPSNTELSMHMTLNPGERIDAMDKAFPNANPILAITVRTAGPYTVASAHLVTKNPNGGHDLKQIFHQAADTANFSAANIDKWADEIAKSAEPHAIKTQGQSHAPPAAGAPPAGKGMLDDIPGTPGMIFKDGPPAPLRRSSKDHRLRLRVRACCIRFRPGPECKLFRPHGLSSRHDFLSPYNSVPGEGISDTWP